MDEIFKGKKKKGLETGDISLLMSIKNNRKSKEREWNGFHYSCSYRSVEGIMSIMSNLRSSEPLLDTDPSGLRPCDLLPIPELNFFNLYSWGVGTDYQLGYPKDKQPYPKKIDLKPSNYPPE